MAICTDETPRIHYYSLFNNDNPSGPESSLQYLMQQYRPIPPQVTMGRKYEEFWLAPLRSKPSEFSWTASNRLLYLWDDGLRNACRESRAVVLAQLAKHPRPRKSKSLVVRERGDAFVRVSKRDVFCLRFSPKDLRAAVSLRWDVLLPRLPFVHLPRSYNDRSDHHRTFHMNDSTGTASGS